jgi:hypothetical protein
LHAYLFEILEREIERSCLVVQLNRVALSPLGAAPTNQPPQCIDFNPALSRSIYQDTETEQHTVSLSS